MYRDENSGEIMFDLAEFDDFKSAFKDLLKTEIGQTFMREFYDADSVDEVEGKLKNAISVLFPDQNGHASLNQLSIALENLLLSGEVKPLETGDVPLDEPKPEEVDTTPRDKNGRPLSESQLKWREFRQFADSASMSEISLRKRSDPEFANFVRKNMEREMSQPIGDAVENMSANQVPQKSGVPADVRAFASRYPRMSVAELKRLLSPATNPDGPAAARETQRLFDAATADGLI